MWIKLGNDLLNLDHVVRVRFNKGWKAGQEELVAELDGLIRGEVQTFVRYRGADADRLYAVLEGRAASPEPVPSGPRPDALYANPFAVTGATTNTLHDL